MKFFEKSGMPEVVGDHQELAVEPVRPGDQRPGQGRVEEGRFPWRRHHPRDCSLGETPRQASTELGGTVVFDDATGSWGIRGVGQSRRLTY